ncbi:MAG: cell division protein SepF [Thaumarchaeota archaeon]|nr:cell division protein SepF [Nitrososphaerota archaeon]
MSSKVVEEQKLDDKGDGILLKALALRSIEDIQKIQEDVAKKTIVILKVTPLAQKNVDELKSSVEQLYEFATSIGGDIARLGDERVVITPPGVKIWRGLQ